MSRYIDFEIAREYLHKACERLGSNGGLMLKIKFDEEPKADVKPVVRSEWIELGNGAIRCKKCGWAKTGLLTRNYCPNCGADMRGGEKDG